MCGIIGVIGPECAADEVYSGLLTLQHRGQDAAGILSYDFAKQQFFMHKNSGFVSDVFAPLYKAQGPQTLQGQMALGHTRYQTVGSEGVENLQPLVMNYPYGLGMVHNGNLVNYYSLIQELQQQSFRHSFSSNDLEVILHLIGEELAKHQEQFRPEMIEAAVKNVFDRAQGGYAGIGLIAGAGLFAFRDPQGIRPLVLGKKGNSYAIASETRALKFLDYRPLRDVVPGEALFISREGKLSSFQIHRKTPRPCMFEWIYFANAESQLDQRPVYQTRLEFGRRLGKKILKLKEQGVLNPDVVVPVPETSRVAAIALAETLGIPYRELFIKNPYVQRSFILKSQRARKNAIELKLSPIEEEIRGKKILLVDDSIVRGTTSRHLVALAKKVGALEVDFASTCPEIRHPCFFGIDFPTEEELIAHGRDHQEIADHLGAQSVVYLDLKDLKEAINLPDLCTACLTGDYPMDMQAAQEFKRRRDRDRRG